jgi:copper type II ascorbate-dependent monooxygenase-like protein
MKTCSCFVLLACMAAVACGSDDQSPGAPAAAEPEAAGLTFWQHVAPIVSQKCAGCHQSGGIAPFALESYQDVQSRAGLIADITASRRMPPYLMETGDGCGSFDESVALTQAEITTIGDWARGDRAEGTRRPVTLRPRPGLDQGTDFQTPSFIPEVAGGMFAEHDEYRCFLIDPGLDADTFVTGYEVLPGNPALVHHVLGMFVDPNAPAELPGQTNAALMQALDDESPERDGWPCFGMAGDGVSTEDVPLVWAPGQGVVDYPGGAGVRLRRDRKLVVQVHYNLENEELHGQSDQTTVRLRFSDTVGQQALFVTSDLLLDSLFSGEPTPLEPGKASVSYTWQQSAEQLGLPPDTSMQLLGLMPHMHQRGRKYTFELGKGDALECQGHVDAWDFHWQRLYMYREPLTLNADTQLRVSCDYDTSHDTQPVLPGWGTRNEMCAAIMMLAYPPGVFR